MCVHVWRISTFVCNNLCIIRGQKTSRVLFCCFPLHSIETESITGLTASFVVSKNQWSSCLNPYSAGVLGMLVGC